MEKTMEDTFLGAKSDDSISAQRGLRVIGGRETGRSFPLAMKRWYAWKLFSPTTGTHRHSLIYVFSKRFFRGIEGPDILQLDYHDVTGLENADARADLYVLDSRPGYLAGDLIYMTPPVCGTKALVAPVSYRWVDTAFPKVLSVSPPLSTTTQQEPIQHYLNRVLW